MCVYGERFLLLITLLSLPYSTPFTHTHTPSSLINSPQLDHNHRPTTIHVSSEVSGWGLRVEGWCGAPPCVALPPTTPNSDHHHQEGVTQEGVTLSVLDQRNATLIFHKVFPLSQYWAHWSDLSWHLRRVAPGRIVVLALSVRGTVGLRRATSDLVRLGALLVPHLPPKARWTWIFVKGGRTICETAVLAGNSSQHAHVTTSLSYLPSPEPILSSTASLERHRWQYCTQHGVLSGLCDEHSPDRLPLQPAKHLNNDKALINVPIIVTAGARYQYLYHTLSTLYAAPGFYHHNLLVVLGDAPPATTNLLSLLNISHVSLTVHATGNTKLFSYYHDVFHLIATRYSEAPVAIILDEDIEVSPDFFSYMSQTLWLLKADPSLYCINAHASADAPTLVYNDSRVFRGSIQVEWGYAITLDFVREALKQWNTLHSITLLYDFWLFMTVRGERECLFPEMSRSRHFGMGVNTNSYLKEFGPLNMPMVNHAPVLLEDASRLQLDTWRINVRKSITAATVLQGNPCSATFLPSPPTSSLYVFYYKLEKLSGGGGRPVPYQYFHMAECLGVWSMSEQGHHEGVRMIRFARNATLFTVGVPFSSYSHLWPRNPALWDIDTLSEQEMEQMGEYRRPKYIIANHNVTTEVLMAKLTSGNG